MSLKKMFRFFIMWNWWVVWWAICWLILRLRWFTRIIFWSVYNPWDYVCQYQYLWYSCRFRSKVNYKEQLKIGSIKQTRISEDCIFHQVTDYHVTENISVDIMTWLGKERSPTQWGRRNDDDYLEAITPTKPPAPEYLFNIISCNCKKLYSSSCTCRKFGMSFSKHVK